MINFYILFLHISLSRGAHLASKTSDIRTVTIFVVFNLKKRTSQSISAFVDDIYSKQILIKVSQVARQKSAPNLKLNLYFARLPCCCFAVKIFANESSIYFEVLLPYKMYEPNFGTLMLALMTLPLTTSYTRHICIIDDRK